MSLPAPECKTGNERLRCGWRAAFPFAQKKSLERRSLRPLHVTIIEGIGRGAIFHAKHSLCGETHIPKSGELCKVRNERPVNRWRRWRMKHTSDSRSIQHVEW